MPPPQDIAKEYGLWLAKFHSIAIEDIAHETGLHEKDVLPKIAETLADQKPGAIEDSKSYEKCTKEKIITVLKKEAPLVHKNIAARMKWSTEQAKKYFVDHHKPENGNTLASLGLDGIMATVAKDKLGEASKASEA